MRVSSGSQTANAHPHPSPWGVSGARLTSYAHALAISTAEVLSSVRTLVAHPDLSCGDDGGHRSYARCRQADRTITAQRNLETVLPSRSATDNITKVDSLKWKRLPAGA